MKLVLLGNPENTWIRSVSLKRFINTDLSRLLTYAINTSKINSQLKKTVSDRKKKKNNFGVVHLLE